jgi:hypothetical protein
MKKNILLLLLTIFSLVTMNVVAQDPYAEFEELYPGCVDNEDSPIYGGTYGKWPTDLNLPEFPNGGDVQLIRFVHDNLEYPEVIESVEYSEDKKDSVVHLAKGTVAVQIVVDRCGRASRAEIIQSVNDAYDEEALRILSGLPVFKPGDLNGERVKVALIVPVHFSRSTMPPPPESEYGDYWGDGEDWGDDSSSDDSSDDYDSYDSYEDYNYDDW